MTAELKAGRELDALVAEHVMRWTNVGMVPDLDWNEYPVGIPPDDPIQAIVLHYSTDIAAAWLVVEHMRQESANLSSDVWTRWTNALAVKFQFSTHKLMLEITPEDICLAALEAVGCVPHSSTAASVPSGS